MGPRGFDSAAVIGLGTMGAGIALLLAEHGLEVHVADTSDGLARQLVAGALARRERTGPGAPDVSIRVAADPEDAARGRELVIEAIPEVLEAKLALLARISAAAPGAVVATNTSSLSIDILARRVSAPERFLGVHFFNPADLVPGVEVIRSQFTDPSVVDRLVEFLVALGKVPSVVRSSPGFIANRLQLALFLEALRCVDEGLASASTIDSVVRSTFGFRLPAFGPLAVADLAGLDVFQSILEELHRGLGERFAVPDSLRALVTAGRLGLKSGGGFYDYDQPVEETIAARDRAYRSIAKAMGSIPTGHEGAAPNAESR